MRKVVMGVEVVAWTTVLLLLAACMYESNYQTQQARHNQRVAELSLVEHDELEEHQPGVVGAGVPRSPQWPRVRNAYFTAHPACEFKGCKTHEMKLGDPRRKFNVHHVEPFHINPAKELDPRNLITLCVSPENHHLYVGHLGDFQDVNPRVRRDCQEGHWPEKGLEAKARHDAKAKP